MVKSTQTSCQRLLVILTRGQVQRQETVCPSVQTQKSKHWLLNFLKRLNSLHRMPKAELVSPQKPGLWDSVGQSIVKSLEDYNRQSYEQTQGYINQTRQKKTEPRTVQQQPRSAPVKSSNQCAQMDAQILAACRLKNFRPVLHLKARFLDQGCEFSRATSACIEKCLVNFPVDNPCLYQ